MQGKTELKSVVGLDSVVEDRKVRRRTDFCSLGQNSTLEDRTVKTWPCSDDHQ